jgi:hypothetical protein
MVTRCLGVVFCGLLSAGCMGLLIGDPRPYAYVMRMGSADAIGRWTSQQTNGRKLYDGLSALSARMDEAREPKEVEEAVTWKLAILLRIEDWRPERPLPSTGEQWTTATLVEKTFADAAYNGYGHPRDEGLLYRMRPDGDHARWLPAWEKSVADLSRWRHGEEARARRPSVTLP